MYSLFNYVDGDWILYSFIFFIIFIIFIAFVIHAFIASAVKKGVLDALNEKDKEKIDN